MVALVKSRRKTGKSKSGKYGSYGGTATKKGGVFSAAWAALRKEVNIRDRYKCTVCGRHIADLLEHEQLQVDHVRLIANGGTDTLGNLKSKCSTCHGKRHGHQLTRKANEARKKSNRENKPFVLVR